MAASKPATRVTAGRQSASGYNRAPFRIRGPLGDRVKRVYVVWLGVCVIALVGLPAQAFAQSDEIQVYDAGLAPRGVFNLTLHTNFTPKGIKTPAFPGAVVSDKSLNGVPEWALGVRDWFEAGLYLPLYTRDNRNGWGLDGFKLRALFAVPRADDRHFFYGANFEFSVNAKRWDAKRVSSEVRPIVGWHVKKVDLILNPIVDTAYDGFENLEFVPSTRVAYHTSVTTAIAVETYSDFGPLKGFLPAGQQVHQLFAVIDHPAGGLNIEAGIGVGLNHSSDRLQLKLILSRDLNKKK
jgi:hypothetical protein